MKLLFQLADLPLPEAGARIILAIAVMIGLVVGFLRGGAGVPLAAVLSAAGGRVTTLDGIPFAYGKRNQANDVDFANMWFLAASGAPVVEAEAEVPRAMAEAFRSGNLGIMDYYRMKNLQADTDMRAEIAGTDGSGNTGGGRSGPQGQPG